MRGESETDRVREELAAKQSAVYRGSTVWQADPNAEVYQTVHGTFNNLRAALNTIDANLPIESYVREKLDTGRGAYRPDEVAEFIREAVAFGETRGRLAAEQYPAGPLTRPIPPCDKSVY